MHEPSADTAFCGLGARLDILHGAAARADGGAYFDCFDSDAVFLGTDASERWTLAQFKDYASPRFAQGQGWTYTPMSRTISMVRSVPGEVLYFDELLRNAKYGVCRGSGVAVRVPGEEPGHAEGWRILQYNLTFTVPNGKAAAVVEIIRGAG